MATPSAPIRPFSDPYLFDYSNEHVFYEIGHFFWLAQALGSGVLRVGAPSPGDTRRLNNILIEGFAIHLRNVIDFLYVKPQLTDVVAEDFFPEGDWKKIRPAMTASLDAARIRANKEIAHLTTDRIGGSSPAKTWDFVRLGDEIKPILQLMSSKALPTRLGSNVGKAIR